MHLGIFGCNIGAAVTGLAAAWFWFRSALVVYPTRISVMTPYGGGVANMNNWVQAAQNSARLNRWAAGFSAATALFVAISAIIDLAA